VYGAGIFMATSVLVGFGTAMANREVLEPMPLGKPELKYSPLNQRVASAELVARRLISTYRSGPFFNLVNLELSRLSCKNLGETVSA
jgi:hypothetical protein